MMVCASGTTEVKGALSNVRVIVVRIMGWLSGLRVPHHGTDMIPVLDLPEVGSLCFRILY